MHMLMLMLMLMLMGLKLAHNIGVWRVGMEVGCQDLIGMIQKGVPCLASNGVLVDNKLSFYSLISYYLFFFHRGFDLIFRAGVIGTLAEPV